MANSIVLTFRHHLPLRGSGFYFDLSIVHCKWRIPPRCSRLSGHSWQYMSTSTSVFLHFHFENCSDVFRFISSFDVPEQFQPSPSHNLRYRFHLCFLQYLLICPVFCIVPTCNINYFRIMNWLKKFYSSLFGSFIRASWRTLMTLFSRVAVEVLQMVLVLATI